MYRRVESEQQSFVSKKRRTTRTKTDVLGAHGHVREWEIDYCERIDREEVDRGESRHDRVVLRARVFSKESGPVRDESEARAHARSTRSNRSNEYECRAKEEVCGRGGIRPGE